MKSMAEEYQFTATIEAGARGGALVVFPFDVEAEFHTRGSVKVKASFDGESYRGSLAPMSGRHILGITKSIRSRIGKDIGDTVLVVVVEDLEERSVDVPKALDEALLSNPTAQAKFESLAFTYRKEFAKWITDARKIETREKRLKKAIQMIIDGEKL